MAQDQTNNTTTHKNNTSKRKKKEKVNNCFLVVFKKIKILKKNQLKKQNKQNKN